MARYAGQLLAPAEVKTGLSIHFKPFYLYFVFSINLSNFIQKIFKKLSNKLARYNNNKK